MCFSVFGKNLVSNFFKILKTSTFVLNVVIAMGKLKIV